MLPSIGRVVHFHEEGGPYAALITAVNPSGTVELVTFGKNSVYFQHNVQGWFVQEETPPRGTWTWPPKV